MIDSLEVAAAHDQMASEYDDLADLWYPWLFHQIHRFIAAHLPVGRGSNRAVDAGCGTGFQSFLLAQAGYDVVGFDIADGLLDVARAKTAAFSVVPGESPPLFRPHFSWSREAHQLLVRSLDAARGDRAVHAPTFVNGNLTTFAFEPGLDVIVCCGSVLSFIDGYADSIGRMARALAPEGLLFIEVEQRWNLDLLWPAVDRFLGGRLEYGQSWPVILSNLLSPLRRSVRVDYPFELRDGGQVTLPIWLFSVREIEALFHRLNLTIRGCLGIHQVTNLIPSTILHQAPPGAVVRRIFEPLRRLDGALGVFWPFKQLGCSVIYCVQHNGAETSKR